ncbi:hypothetical protein B0T17DRAFT_488289 [Bombardia bombarda]|uniref:DUF7580 domain-containing protein n=1 Tax=Bombardia bombarda TaxID=252184 RepID=A0AA40CAH0_9PEZI|nr:hypothetical protein B0T17DRAFT_488289 [Bombardia bombarda]
MSGFEIAGAALGAFPLAIHALDQYREVAARLGLFFKIRLEYKKCRDDVHFHQLTFSRHLRQLLLPLVADDATIADLLSDPGGQKWKDPKIAELLETRLQESYGLYLEYIKGIRQVMDEINRELAVDTGSVQEKLASPSLTKSVSSNASRLKAAIGNKEGRAFQLYRVKFSNGETVRKRLFGELQEYNDKLERLLDSSDSETRLVTQRKALAEGVAIEAAICSFWIHARRLFKVLTSALDCPGPCQDHGANLVLQHRTSKKPEFQVTFTKAANLAVSSPNPILQWEIQRTKILESDEETAAAEMFKESVSILEDLPRSVPLHRQPRQIKSSFATKKESNTTGTSTSRSTATTMGSTPKPNLAHISNLCADLSQHQTWAQGSCCGYLLEAKSKRRYYVHPISRQHTTTQPSVTLDQILRGGVSLPRLSRTQRYNIALTLASSFLQLLGSPWLPTAAFHRTDILFIKDKPEYTSGFGQGLDNVLRLDQPLVHRQLWPVDSHVSKDGTEDEGDFRFADSLDQLGIMLLELCFGNGVLADQPYRQRWPAGANATEKAVFDVMAARDWQCRVNEEAGPDYAEAVAWCLGGNRSSGLDWWRRDMLSRVIQPLQRCRDYLTAGMRNE